MNTITRRKFLKRSISTAAGSLALSSCPGLISNVRGANNQVRVAVAGIRSRGGAHIKQFHGLPGVKVVAICDADRKVLGDWQKRFKKNYNASVKGYLDIRRLLEQKDIDALVIAAPNHWHSLMTVYACQAGKHVYVEKPVSHSIEEGRKMVKAARK